MIPFVEVTVGRVERLRAGHVEGSAGEGSGEPQEHGDRVVEVVLVATMGTMDARSPSVVNHGIVVEAEAAPVRLAERGW